MRVMSGKRPRLQIMTDRLDGKGVDVDDCAGLSRALSEVFEIEDPASAAGWQAAWVSRQHTLEENRR